jgi:hypothetical protein
MKRKKQKVETPLSQRSTHLEITFEAMDVNVVLRSV